LSRFRIRRARRLLVSLGALAVWLLSQTGMAQTAPGDPSQRIDAAGGFLQSQGAQPRFEAASKLSADARIAVKQGRIFSVPHFTGSFAFEGTAYPYTIVGSKPQAGGSTEIPTQLIPISLYFEE